MIVNSQISQKPIPQYLLRKSMDWFLYDIGIRQERVKVKNFEKSS